MGACRFCGAPLQHVCATSACRRSPTRTFAPDQLDRMEPFYPLRALVCGQCFLVQLEEFETPEQIFSDYAYFSSYSTSWLDHARRYTEMAIERFGLGADSTVVEIASNDGYLLQYFHERGIPVLGVEPAANVAQAAIDKGIPTVVRFFGVEAARELAQTSRADLLIGNNVLAHVPGPQRLRRRHEAPARARRRDHDGVPAPAAPDLRATSSTRSTTSTSPTSRCSTAQRVFAAHGLALFDVEELPTHGGSLRIYGRHAEDESRPVSERVQELAERERAAGYEDLAIYAGFADRVRATKRDVLALPAGQGRGRLGRRLRRAGQGQHAAQLLRRRHRLPRLHRRPQPAQAGPLPARHPHPDPRARRRSPRRGPTTCFILPWNLKDEIIEQMAHIRDWGGRFVVRTPDVEVLP